MFSLLYKISLYVWKKFAAVDSSSGISKFKYKILTASLSGNYLDLLV